MTKKRSDKEVWGDLTWGDVGRWSDSRSISRGKSYAARDAVHGLARSAGGELLAWVIGTERYATRVNPGRETKKGRSLKSECSCPVRSACKHAVAVLVTALKCVEDGVSLDIAPKDDRRWAMAAADWPGEVERHERSAAAPLQAYLESLEKRELIDLVVQHIGESPGCLDALDRQRLLAEGEVQPIVERLEREIEQQGEIVPWSNHWKGTSELPDYSGVEAGLRELARLGHHDEVIELGEQLFDAGLSQLGQGHDDGETGMAIADCFKVIARSIAKASLEDHEKVLLAMGWLERDEYEVASSLGWMVEGTWTVDVWARVAESLMVRLDKASFSSKYRRGMVSGWVIAALDRAGETETADRLCEVEAVQSGEYLRIVERYVEQERWDEVEEWARRGFEEVRETQRGTADRLAGHLAQLALARKDWPLSAAFAARSFFARPSTATLAALESAAAKARCKGKVRAAAIAFLQNGVDVRESPEWPLPSTGLVGTAEPRGPKGAKPQAHWDVLRDLALKEGRHAVALTWHDRIVESRRIGRLRFSRVRGEDLVLAGAVASTHPDRAIEIYLQAAHERVKEKNPKGYAIAGERLRQIRDILVPLGRSEEWETLMASFREENRRRPRMMEVLDGLDGRPILSNHRKRRC